MKRSLSLVLTVVFLALALVACGGSEMSETGTESNSDTQTPTQTEAPTDSEMPDQSDTESGTDTDSESESESSEAPKTLKYLRSDTGTQLNMVLEYDVAENGNGGYTVDATLKLECYSLNVTARPNSNYIRVGDENYYFSTEAISYDGEEMTTFTLGTHRFEISTKDSEIPVYAIWYFNGVYNDKPITAVIIDGAIELE